jgi:hypothetical protein
VNEVAKTITLAFLRDKLTAVPDLDLTPFATAPPSIEWSERARVHLSAGTSITGAAPAVDSVDDLVRRYGSINLIATSGTKASWPVNALYFVRAENVFLVKESTGTGQVPKFLRFSPLFDFTTPGEGDVVDTASLDEQLPLFAAYYYDPEGKEEHRYILPGVMETALVNSTLVYSDSDKEQTAPKRDTPIMFCFSLPRLQQQVVPLPAGTTAAYDWTGSGWSDVSLNIAYDHSLAGRFFAPYSHFLSYSNFAVNCLLRLPLSRLQTLDLSTPKLLFNQPVLVERIKCRIGTGIFEITETTFRTLKSYEDA